MKNSTRILRRAELVDGKYRILSHLSSGGMGDVYAAEHVYTHRHVALKVMRHRDEGAEALFLREAEAVSAIDHPGVVEMLDAGRSAEGTWYAVFELLEGRDLEAILIDGGVSVPDLCRIAVDLLHALAATHSTGYVHRDVKPANVFITADPTGAPRVKLLDFGIAAQVGPDGAPALGHRVGTLDYMSPEQAQGHNVDGRTDVWSVGALMFRALTGRSPVQARRPADVLRRLIGEDVARLSAVRDDLPTELCEVVDRALARRPQDRWASADDMAQALLLVEPSLISPLGPPRGRKPRPARLGASQRRFCVVTTVDLIQAAAG